jgi:hypothetical protein
LGFGVWGFLFVVYGLLFCLGFGVYGFLFGVLFDVWQFSAMSPERDVAFEY